MEKVSFSEILEMLAKREKIKLSEAKEEAIRLYFSLRPELKMEGIIDCYLDAKVSLSRAAELAGVTVPEFKEILALRGIVRETEGKETPEMDKKITKILG